jgi:formate/nitrite transporter FocA (FNT family)
LAEDKKRGREGGSRENGSARQGSEAPEGSITEKELEEIEELSSPRAPVIYQIVRRHGEEELERPVTSLWWSGVAAGLSISFSLLAQGILRQHLPDAPWRILVAGFGYSVGFLIVVLGRQQLFTESTITAVLPVLKELTPHNVWRMSRLWVIVLVANLAGTLFAAAFSTYFPVVPQELYDSMLAISREIAHLSWWQMCFRAVTSGFLIAAMVWMLPAAETAKLPVITLMTWLIAVGGFTHVVAGSMEAYMLVLAGDWQWWRFATDFFAPVLLGNMVGGTALFALISYAQVMEEI